MAEFYSARGWEIPPLPWTNLSPPFSTDLTGSQRIGVTPVLLLFLVGLVLMAWVRAGGEEGKPSDRVQ